MSFGRYLHPIEVPVHYDSCVVIEIIILIFWKYFLSGFDPLRSKNAPERVSTISDAKNIFVVYWNTIDLFAAPFL